MRRTNLATCVECIGKISLILLPLAAVGGVVSYFTAPGSPLFIIFLTVAGTFAALWLLILLGSSLAVLTACRKIGGTAMTKRELLQLRLRYLLSAAVGVAALGLAFFWHTAAAVKIAILAAAALLIAGGNLACVKLRVRHRKPTASNRR